MGKLPTLRGSPSEAEISVGSVVSAGQIIAKVGHNGKSTGAHLHLAMTIDGKKADPEPYIQFYLLHIRNFE